MGNQPHIKSRPIGWVALPVALFATVAVLFAVSLKPGGDPSRLPSVFIGKPAPAYAFASIPELATSGFNAAGFDQSALGNGKVTVVNFWASWCAPCVDEHPHLTALAAKPGVTLAGVNVKDDPSNARQFLSRHGNPFAMLASDRNGRGSIEWGVYGTPETFIVNGRGQITLKHVGPISASDLETKIYPAIEAAKK
jgi:cytochrome c biogenesis protein CcmG, thiol:disulfide interchange protein DsbE